MRTNPIFSIISTNWKCSQVETEDRCQTELSAQSSLLLYAAQSDLRWMTLFHMYLSSFQSFVKHFLDFLDLNMHRHSQEMTIEFYNLQFSDIFRIKSFHSDPNCYFKAMHSSHFTGITIRTRRTIQREVALIDPRYFRMQFQNVNRTFSNSKSEYRS